MTAAIVGLANSTRFARPWPWLVLRVSPKLETPSMRRPVASADLFGSRLAFRLQVFRAKTARFPAPYNPGATFRGHVFGIHAVIMKKPRNFSRQRGCEPRIRYPSNAGRLDIGRENLDAHSPVRCAVCIGGFSRNASMAVQRYSSWKIDAGKRSKVPWATATCCGEGFVAPRELPLCRSSASKNAPAAARLGGMTDAVIVRSVCEFGQEAFQLIGRQRQR